MVKKQKIKTALQSNQIGVLGDGAWGTTLAILLSKKGLKVSLWGNFPKYLDCLNKKRENIKYLPGIKIPKDILFEKDINKLIKESNVIIIAIPSKYFRSSLKKIKTRNLKGKIFVSGVKGIEENTLKRMSEVIREELGQVSFAVLSGPTIASEVSRKMPSVAVISSKNQQISKKLQEIFFTDYFRVYRQSDVIGVELGGALKNIIAIVAGMSDGLGFGANSKAALLARGIVEITRLGVKMDAKKKTFFGISGLGDLATTCISKESRNRTFGERIGRGEKIKNVLLSMEEARPDAKVRGVPEGVTTAKAVYKLSKIYRVDMPITQGVYKVLYKGKSPKRGLVDLMRRKKKQE